MVYTGTSNVMKSRSVPGVALKPSNNDGGQYFMWLYTRKKVHSYIREELPIGDGVIQRVEQLAELEKQPVLVDSNHFFEWTPGISIEEVEIEEDSAEDIVIENVDIDQGIAQEIE